MNRKFKSGDRVKLINHFTYRNDMPDELILEIKLGDWWEIVNCPYMMEESEIVLDETFYVKEVLARYT